MRLFCAASLAAAIFGCFPAMAQDLPDCKTNYRTSSEVSEEFPGTLAASRNTGCRHTRSFSGKARGSAPGRAAGFDVVQAPKNGKVTVDTKSGSKLDDATVTKTIVNAGYAVTEIARR